jgi:hypothetical protein
LRTVGTHSGMILFMPIHTARARIRATTRTVKHNRIPVWTILSERLTSQIAGNFFFNPTYPEIGTWMIVHYIFMEKDLACNAYA